MKYKNQSINKRKKFIFLFVLIIVISIIVLLILKNNKNLAKNFKIGNNTTSQEIVDNFLNISSYEATIEVKIKSTKNENKYIIKQKYEGEEKNKQEVIEPSNIAGVKIIKDGSTLTLENTKLNLTSIYENYEYLSNNDLDLNSFIKDFKENKNQEIKEKNNQIIIKTNSQKNSFKIKTLYISKETGMPIKMEVQDNNKNIAVYILYNEVNVNS